MSEISKDKDKDKDKQAPNPDVKTAASPVQPQPIDWEKEYWNLLKNFRNLGLTISVSANNIEAQMEEKINPELARQRREAQGMAERGRQGPGIPN